MAGEEITKLNSGVPFVMRKQDSKFTLANLSYFAEKNNCQLVFFGHTHVATDTIMGNVRMINPGAASGYNPSCAVVETDGKGNGLVNHIKI